MILKFRKASRNLCLFLIFCLGAQSLMPVLAAAQAKPAVTPASVVEEDYSQEPVLTPVPTVTPVLSAWRVSKELQEQMKGLRQDQDKIAKDLSALEQRLSKQEDGGVKLDAVLADIRDKLKTLQDNVDRVDANWRKENQDNIKKADLESVKSGFDDLKLSAGKAVDQVNDFETEIKKEHDQVAGLNDMMSVLRKDVSDNAEDIAAVRKNLKEMMPKAQVEKEGWDFSDFVKWPFWGITAAGVALVALVIAVTK